MTCHFMMLRTFNNIDNRLPKSLKKGSNIGLDNSALLINWMFEPEWMSQFELSRGKFLSKYFWHVEPVLFQVPVSSEIPFELQKRLE